MVERESPSYYRVVMSLGQILETKFLTQYIKLGASILLVSPTFQVHLHHFITFRVFKANAQQEI